MTDGKNSNKQKLLRRIYHIDGKVYISGSGLRKLFMHSLNIYFPESTFFKIIKESGISPDYQLLSGIRLYSLDNVDKILERLKQYIMKRWGRGTGAVVPKSPTPRFEEAYNRFRSALKELETLKNEQ